MTFQATINGKEGNILSRFLNIIYHSTIMFKLVLLIFLINDSSQLVGFKTILEVSRLVYYTTKASWELMLLTQLDHSRTEELETELLIGLNKLSKNVDFVSDRLDMYQRNTMDKLNLIQSEIKYEIQMNFLLDNIIDIETNYKLLKSYTEIKSNSKIEKFTLKDFARTTVSHSESSVYSKFLKINMLIVPQPHNVIARKGLFEVITNYLSETGSLCGTTQSPSQLIIHAFLFLQITQIKALIMIQYSWMLLRIYNEGDFVNEGQILTDTFIKQMSNQAEELLNTLRGASNAMWKCDPRTHLEDKTFTQITNFMQLYIINEVDINYSGTCWQNCAYYTLTEQYDCYQNLFCADQPKCNGTIVGCKYRESSMWVCHNPSREKRLYDYIQFDDGNQYGRETQCTSSTKASSWWRWLFWHCSYCFCYCDDPTNSDRYFNLRQVVSDVANNKVVTGIKLIKTNKVIYLQIQQGQLVEGATVNVSSVEWLPVEAYNISDSKIKTDVDYHSLTWEHRALDLDDVLVPENYVVTGVKFRRLGGNLNIEIRASKFNETTGKLINPSEYSYWQSNDNTDGNLLVPRTEVELIRPDIPTRSNNNEILLKSRIDSKSNQFVKFQSTDEEFDAGQTTVPFIDVQAVAPYPPVPLVGIGIYHKGHKYSGGFIAPKVFTYNNEKNIVNYKKKLEQFLNDHSLPFPQVKAQFTMKNRSACSVRDISDQECLLFLPWFYTTIYFFKKYLGKL